jgi:hypothetical protein
MLVFSFVVLGALVASILLGLRSKEEIFRVSMACTAIVSLVVFLVISPWSLKLAIVAIPFAFDNFLGWIADHPWY